MRLFSAVSGRILKTSSEYGIPSLHLQGDLPLFCTSHLPSGQSVAAASDLRTKPGEVRPECGSHCQSWGREVAGRMSNGQPQILTAPKSNRMFTGRPAARNSIQHLGESAVGGKGRAKQRCC